MRNKYIEGVEAAHLRKDLAKFEIGDTVSVGVRIVEGNKERVQPFIGVVIARRGHGVNETFTVRRIVADEGVERIFLVHSPRIAAIDVKRHGKVRRSKLYYLRERVGKARKLRERRLTIGREQPEGGAEGHPGTKSPATHQATSSKAEVAATV